MPSITQVSVPVTMLGGMAAGLWFVFDLFTQIEGRLEELSRTHDRFEYTVKIQNANEQMREMEGRDRTEEEQRQYDLLKQAVHRYTEKRDELM